MRGRKILYLVLQNKNDCSSFCSGFLRGTRRTPGREDAKRVCSRFLYIMVLSHGPKPKEQGEG